MTTYKATPALLTVQEAAQMLRLSDDTVRRQIREGSLQAFQVRTTPTGRAQYRIPSEAVLKLLGQDAPADPLEPLREAFAELSEADQEALLREAVEWARARTPESIDPTEKRLPALTPTEIQARFGNSRLNRQKQD